MSLKIRVPMNHVRINRWKKLLLSKKMAEVVEVITAKQNK
jgi:hypothetical protein